MDDKSAQTVQPEAHASEREARPVPTIRFDRTSIPIELSSRSQWVCWRYEWRQGKTGEQPKLTKVPVNPKSGTMAKVTESGHWSGFEEACKKASSSSGRLGIGFVFTKDDPLAGVDLDDCIVDGVVTPDAAALIAQFGTYAEISPSGTGVKLFLAGRKPEDASCRKRSVHGCGEIEIYDQGRFFVVTGAKLDSAPASVNPAQGPLDALCEELWPAPPPVGAATPNAASVGFGGSDDELIERMFNAKNGDKTKALFNGDTSAYGGDDSAADLALCCCLAFWTGKDAERMDRIFRQSKLFRPKWERANYREATIGKAVSQCREVYKGTGSRPSGLSSRDLPEIILDVDEHRVTDETIEALEGDPDLYHRGNVLVRVLRGEQRHDGVARDDAAPTISPLQTATVRERITKFARLVKYNAEGEIVPMHPPGWLVSQVSARGWWPGLRHLAGISDAPVLRPDGSICQTAGYDDITGVLYLPSAGFPIIPETLTRDDAVVALAVLEEVVLDFQFESAAHKAGWLAAVLTVVSRHAFGGPAPLFLVDANVRGAGKGLLCQSIARMTVGRPMPVSSNASDVDEMRKRITAIAIAGDQLVLLDNVEGKLGNAALDAALTTTRWTDRILGESRQVDLPLRPTWFATGNNVQVGADTTRRIIHIRLDVLEERPEKRTGFRHPDLLKWIDENRGRLLAAALTILAAYIRAGKPKMSTATMGSFEGWADLIPQAVMWVGLSDPRVTQETLQAFSDNNEQVLRQLHQAMFKYDPQCRGVVIANMVNDLYGDQRSQGDPSASMRAALETLTEVKSGVAPTIKQVAARFRGFRRRVVGGYYLDFDPHEETRNGALWKMCRKPNGEPMEPGPATDGAGASAEAPAPF